MKRNSRTRQPRCLLVYALAPEHLGAAKANRQFNDFVGDTNLPLALFHDHFIGQPGGVAIFFVETVAERDALLDGEHLPGWSLEFQPLIYARSPAAFDEQIAFTLKAYRNRDWEALRREARPRYGDASREAEAATEDLVEPMDE
ncbi:MAG: hypothetical protein O3B43_07080 [Chloroflexi bacterium]|nr:hypothetical protein [Chloroflexota bacterium]